MERTTNIKIASFGGGCHWCTEAIFQSLKGVKKVEQGYVASINENSSFSEAVVVHFDDNIISFKILIEIHLHTHKSTSLHSMRNKYRSGVYVFSEQQLNEANVILKKLQAEFDNKIITKVYPFSEFKPSRESIQNYYLKNPDKPFCKRYISPKLKLILEKFTNRVDKDFLTKL